MSAIKPTFFFGLVLLLFSCSENNETTAEDKKEEKLPQLDASLFREVKSDEYRVLILKEMTTNRVAGDVLFSADFLPKEYHFKVVETPISRFKNDPDFPEKKDEQLSWFASNASMKQQQAMRSVNSEQIEEVRSNEQSCFKQTIRGKEYGFPAEKSYFLRFFRTKSSFITISSWTIVTNEAKFQPIAQYMGMSVQLYD